MYKVKGYTMSLELVLKRSHVFSLITHPTFIRSEDLKSEVRKEFKSHAAVSDEHVQKHLISDGKLRLKQLEEMLAMQHQGQS